MGMAGSAKAVMIVTPTEPTGSFWGGGEVEGALFENRAVMPEIHEAFLDGEGRPGDFGRDSSCTGVVATLSALVRWRSGDRRKGLRLPDELPLGTVSGVPLLGPLGKLPIDAKGDAVASRSALLALCLGAFGVVGEDVLDCPG